MPFHNYANCICMRLKSLGSINVAKRSLYDPLATGWGKAVQKIENLNRKK